MLMLRNRTVHGILIEDTVEKDPPMLPLVYLEHWHVTQQFITDSGTDIRTLAALPAPEQRADVAVFIGTDSLASRVSRMESALGPMQLIGTARPGLLDRLMHWLNPVNRNVEIAVYAIHPSQYGAPPATKSPSE